MNPFLVLIWTFLKKMIHFQKITFFHNINKIKKIHIFKILTQFQKHYNFSKWWHLFKMMIHFSKCWTILLNFCPHFQNYALFSKCWPIFNILTNSLNFDKLSKFLPHFKNVNPFSKCWPIFKMLTFFQKILFFPPK